MMKKKYEMDIKGYDKLRLEKKKEREKIERNEIQFLILVQVY